MRCWTASTRCRPGWTSWNGTAVCRTTPKAFRSSCPGSSGRCCRKPTKPRAPRRPRRQCTPTGWANCAESDRLAAFAETIAGGAPLLAVSYVPDEGCFYRGEDPFNLLLQLTGLKALRVFFREPPAPLAETDPFHCALAFRALVGQPRGEVEHLFRYVIEQVAIVAVAPEALILPDGDADGGPGDQDFVEDARRRLAARDFAGLRNAVAGVLERNGSPVWVASALRWLDAVAGRAVAKCGVGRGAGGLDRRRPRTIPSGVRHPRQTAAPAAEADTTAGRRGSHIGQADGGAHSGRADAHHRHAGRCQRQSSAAWRRSRPRSTICWPVSAGRSAPVNWPPPPRQRPAGHQDYCAT